MKCQTKKLARQIASFFSGQNFCFTVCSGAEDESRTHKVLLPQVPETCASAISPLPHIKLRNIFYQKIYFVFAQVSKPSRLITLKILRFSGKPEPLPPQKLAVFWGPQIRHFRICAVFRAICTFYSNHFLRKCQSLFCNLALYSN